MSIPVKLLDLDFFVYFMLYSGAAVTVKMRCNKGHDETWASSKNVGVGRLSVPYVNILLIVYTFLTGLQFDRLKV